MTRRRESSHDPTLARGLTDRGRSMGARWNDGRRFEGKVAVVTGGGGTLGGAVARRFGSEGASVAIGYRSSRPQAAQVVADVEGRGGHAHSSHLDVTDQDSVEAFVNGRTCFRVSAPHDRLGATRPPDSAEHSGESPTVRRGRGAVGDEDLIAQSGAVSQIAAGRR